MKTCAVLASILVLALSALAQPKEENKLVQFHMAIMKKGPKWDTMREQDRNAILEQHVGTAISLLDAGKAVIAGPIKDDSALAGIFILRAASAAEAKTTIDADPQLKQD